jgi:hypothetical protein
MRKIAVLCAAGALVVPSAALAHDSALHASAVHSCKQQRTAMGVQAFKDLYGTNHNKSNALGKCVSQEAKAQKSANAHAQATAPAKCRAERAADPAAFKQKYGTNKNKTDAFGRCVSQTAKADAKQAIHEHDQSIVNAAKACKAERAADPAAFKQKYGTNKNKSNAFGKCVSQKAKANHGSDTNQS